MSTVTPDLTVADLVIEQPTRARVFERFGIDYCCGGRVPLEQACADRGVPLADVLEALSQPLVPGPEDIDWAGATLAALVDHIVTVHHGYLRDELPQLMALVEKVAARHGDGHPELLEVRATFVALADELASHMVKEEQILFPACLALEQERSRTFPFGSVGNPISVMLHEHDEVADALGRIRELTGDFEPPAGACTSYRAMLDRLHALDLDIRRHVHEENNVLFPRALALETA